MSMEYKESLSIKKSTIFNSLQLMNIVIDNYSYDFSSM